MLLDLVLLAFVTLMVLFQRGAAVHFAFSEFSELRYVCSGVIQVASIDISRLRIVSGRSLIVAITSTCSCTRFD